MKHQILGAGAIGHLVAGMLSRANISNEFVLRSNTKNSQHTYYTFTDKTESIQLVRNAISIDELPAIEVLWVCVKAYQLRDVLTSIKPKCSSNSIILLLQNGMGNLELGNEVLGDVLSKNGLFVVSNTHGAFLEQDQENLVIEHTGVGQMKLGGNYLGSTVEKPDFIDSLPDAMNLIWREDIESELWLKLGINAVINPLTAIHQCRNGDLALNEGYKDILDKLIGELKLLYNAINKPDLANAISEQCYQVIENTADNYSSMLRDVQCGRKTELDAITGYLLNAASEAKLVLVEHQKLYERLLNT